MEPISPISEEKGNDGSEFGFQVLPVGRKLDELNQTKTLMRKIEAVSEKTASFKKFASVTTGIEVPKNEDYLDHHFEDTK